MGKQGISQQFRGRLKQEFRTAEAMIDLYCRAHHQSRGSCAGCQALKDYAMRRLAACPFGQQKPACSKCPVHCYKPDMKEQIRQVMRYSGPRMLLRHPVMAIRHLIRSARSKGAASPPPRKRSGGG